MGDNRPAAYLNDDGVWVYRASSIGRCERALRYARKQTPPRELYKTMQAALDKSSNLEDVIRREFEERFKVKVDHVGHRVNIPVGTGAIISGAIDGFGITYDSPPQSGLVEIKAFGEDYWNLYIDQGIQAFPGYVSQFHVYLAGLRLEMGTGVKGGWFIVGKKSEDGLAITDLKWDWIPFDPVPSGRAKATVVRVERWAASEDRLETLEGVECDQSAVCGYWYLHEKPPLPEVDDRVLAALAGRLEMERANRDRADEEIKKITAQIDAAVQMDEGITSVRMGNGHNWWTVTRVAGGTSVKWDKKKLEEKLGDEVDEFRTESTRAGYTRITREKD